MGSRLIRYALLGLFVLIIGKSIIFSIPRGNDLRDFGAFLASGHAITQGANPYAEVALVKYIELKGVSLTPGINLNPPLLLFPFVAVQELNPVKAFRAWYLISLTCYLVTVGLLARAYLVDLLRITWALALAGLWFTLHLGQIYVPLALIVTAAWFLMLRGYMKWAGVLIGCVVAIKPNFAVWPVLFLFAGHYEAAGISLVTAALLSFLPLLVYSPSVYTDWIAGLPTNLFSGPVNASLIGFMADLDLARLGPPLAVVLLVVLVCWAWKLRPPAVDVSGIALIAGILTSPVAWIGYTVLLLPLFLTRTWSFSLTLAAILLTIPSYVVCNSKPLWLFGSIYVFGLLIVLVESLQLKKRCDFFA